MRHLISTVSCLCLTAGLAYAQNCKTVPTCESLGYDSKVSNCSGKKYLTCPFDSSKIFCSDVSNIPPAPSLSNFPGCKELSWSGSEYRCSECYEGYNLNGFDWTCTKTCLFTSTTPPDLSSEFCSKNYYSCVLENAYGKTTYYASTCACALGSFPENGQCRAGAPVYEFGHLRARLVGDDGTTMTFMHIHGTIYGLKNGCLGYFSSAVFPEGSWAHQTYWLVPTQKELSDILSDPYMFLYRKEGSDSNYIFWSADFNGSRRWVCEVEKDYPQSHCWQEENTSYGANCGYIFKAPKSTVNSKCSKAQWGWYSCSI